MVAKLPFQLRVGSALQGGASTLLFTSSLPFILWHISLLVGLTMLLWYFHFLLFGILCYWSAGCYSNIILHFLSATFSTHEYLAFVATLNILIVIRSHVLSISVCSFMVVTCVIPVFYVFHKLLLLLLAVNIILQILFLACSEDNMLILHSSFQHLLFGTLFMIVNVMTGTTHAPYFIWRKDGKVGEGVGVRKRKKEIEKSNCNYKLSN